MRLLAFIRHRLAWTAALVSVVTACSQTPPQVAQAKPKPKPAIQQTFDDSFVHPVPGARISSSFANYIVKSRNRKHHGTDFAAPIGTPVYATRSGVVLSADNTSLSGDFGNAVLIEHGDQFQSLSAHLSRIDVQMGTWVQAGQQIGLVGKTGRATGAHLHFELWQNNLPKDPLQFLPIAESQRLAVKKPEAATPLLAKTNETSAKGKVVSTKSKSKKSSKSVTNSKAKQSTRLAKATQSQKNTKTRKAATEKKQQVAANNKSTKQSSKTKATATKQAVSKQTVAKSTVSSKTVTSKKTVVTTSKAAASSKTSANSKAVKTTELTKNMTESPNDDQASTQKKRGG